MKLIGNIVLITKTTAMGFKQATATVLMTDT